jgi:hypothetical protein
MNAASSKLGPSSHPWGPSPTTIAGALAGGTIGAYTTGPVGALMGLIVGSAFGLVYERFVDSTAPRRPTHPK